MQTTLLGLAIAFIVALVAALIGPYFIDWNQFRPQFEAEASQVIGAPVRVAGALDARLLPTPTLRLRSVMIGGPNDLGKIRADRLDVEFSLGDLMRGDWRANELSIGGLAVDLGLDRQGKIDLPAAKGQFNLGSLSIDRLNLTGRIALHDAASRKTVELNNVAFSGDVRSLAGAVRGDGSFVLDGTRYPFRISSGKAGEGNGTRVRLTIDPAERPLAADLDGVLSFEARSPRFEGIMTLATIAPKPKNSAAPPVAPWRVTAKVKADHDKAQFDQIEASYGSDERVLKFGGGGDVRFGPSPLWRFALAARQFDADRLLTSDGAKDSGATQPLRWLPALRTLMASLPPSPVPAQIAFSAEQITLGGRPVLNLAADLHSEAALWTIDRLDFHAPGGTQVDFSGSVFAAPATAPGTISGVVDAESSDPDALLAWLEGRNDIAYHSQRPLRLRGDIRVTPDRIAMEAMKAEIEGLTMEGRVAFMAPGAGAGSRFEAMLKADRLDLDTAASFVDSVAGPQSNWPDQATVSLDVGSATSSGQEVHPFLAKFSYNPKTLSLEQLKFGQPGAVTMEGAGSFDRTEATGRLTLAATAASLAQLNALAAPFAPALSTRLNGVASQPGAARLKLSLDLGKNVDQADRGSARAVLELDSPPLKGVTTVTAKPLVAALRGIDLDQLGKSELNVESRLVAGRGDSLLALMGLDRVIAAGDGALQFEGSASGVWRAPVRMTAKMWGAGLDAEAQGTAEPWAGTPKANLNLKVRSVNLAPFLGLKPSDGLAQNIRLFARGSLSGDKLALDDLDSVVAGSRFRGHLALGLGEMREIDGEIGLDAVDVAPAFAYAIGASGHDAAEPLGAGVLKGWRGSIAFQALSGMLPGGTELRPVGGTVKGDGQSLRLDGIKGRIGGGDVTGNIDARQDANGIALNGRFDLAGVDGTALHYRGLKMPAGRTSLQMTISSQGRSVAALTGALTGGGTVTLESATIAGLDPHAFDIAIRTSDAGQMIEDSRLRQLVDPVLSAGSLSVASAQVPFSIRDGRLRVDATTLEAQGARAVVSGGYDIPADQLDIRATLSSTTAGSETSRPSVQLFAVGTPDALNRSLDVSALSSWLALRAIDRETQRLDAIERAPPPPEPSPPDASSTPPSTAALPSPPTSPAVESGRPPAVTAMPPPAPPRPRVVVPRPAAPPQGIISQQVAPLPPPIDVRPLPGPPPVKPKPRPPLVLAPQSPPQNIP
ncbi:MAG: AsmA family protein [Bradyrhizobium sp.]|uniref:AsmA family protein n=1 Tax=Bradyrhizobium sp. TaxID=376 RepID=UPI001DE7A6F8|nr:AsmA family protein [Bradyrhizobium sp.]MBV9559800.1 AsmA family protein [Bradyrhizobium sp.]